VAAWRRTGTLPELPPDEDPLLHARRLVAQRCIYGVDKNPLAVDLARLSLWLVTFAKEHPFTFVDHALRSGDSLVGLSKEQIIDLTWTSRDTLSSTGDGEKKPARGKKAAPAAAVQLDLVRPLVVKAVAEADALRQQIHQMGDPPDNTELRKLWRETNEALDCVRLLGDLVVAAYFSGDSDKNRKTALENLRIKVQTWLSAGGQEPELRGMVKDLHEGERPLEPFHWEIEFPEVFGRENPGFDCFVGNPPFLGGTMIATHFGLIYHHICMDLEDSHLGNADIIAFFIRRCFRLLRPSSSFGLVCTNTVSQGDTRSAGLGSVVESGGLIYNAMRRFRWPGEAAVVTSIVNVIKGNKPAELHLDGKPVDAISSYLFRGRVEGSPSRLNGNVGFGYVGSKIWGAGFVFEEEPSGGSWPLSLMSEIIKKNPSCSQVIAAYMGGEELNASPTHKSRRFVIDFREFREPDARKWPELFELVEERVKPIRAFNKQRNYRDDWWLHSTRVPEASAHLSRFRRIIATSRVTKNFAPTFVGDGTVLADTIVLLLLHRNCDFAVLHSSAHECWARFFGSTLGDGLRYTPTSCFETFPFPPSMYPLSSPSPAREMGPGGEASLESIGQSYYEYRAALMADEATRARLMDGLPPEGLTKTYNKFHDPNCQLPGIVRLRELHAQMDRAVLDAYGWQDIKPVCDFREQLDESIRLTWAEETRDEVLARLLELNRVMAEQEAAEAAQGAEAAKAAEAIAKAAKKAAGAEKKPRGGKKKDEPEGQGGLFS